MKKNILLISGIAILLFLSLYIICDYMFGVSFNYEKSAKVFIENEKYLAVVYDYLKLSGHKSVYIHSSMENDRMSVDGNEIQIENTEVIQAIQKLKQQGCNVIAKENSTIHFQIWSNLDGGRGFITSTDYSEPELQYLTECYALSKDNWYYYEADYNEWKTKNETNGYPNDILGVWECEHAQVRGLNKKYKLQDLYGSDEDVVVQLVLYDDGTFIKRVKSSENRISEEKGKFLIWYDNKLKLEYQDGTFRTLKRSDGNEKLVYYYAGEFQNYPIDEYYIKKMK